MPRPMLASQGHCDSDSSVERWPDELDPVLAGGRREGVGEQAVLDSLRALREELADLYARLDAAEAIAATIPSRERYLLLNHRLARRIVEAHGDWLDEVERELG